MSAVRTQMPCPAPPKAVNLTSGSPAAISASRMRTALSNGTAPSAVPWKICTGTSAIAAALDGEPQPAATTAAAKVCG